MFEVKVYQVLKVKLKFFFVKKKKKKKKKARITRTHLKANHKFICIAFVMFISPNIIFIVKVNRCYFNYKLIIKNKKKTIN